MTAYSPITGAHTIVLNTILEHLAKSGAVDMKAMEADLRRKRDELSEDATATK